MERSLEQQLFDVPENVEMPMELCHHLKMKLHSVLEQNWHLKRHVDYLDKEVLQLRKTVAEKDSFNYVLSACQGPDNDPASTMMASKIVELSKKNRDMTAQVEGMKTKIKKLSHENDKLREREAPEPQDLDDRDKSNLETSSPNTNSSDEFAATAQQLSQVTNKMMEYRRQCQQLRMELKTSLRALSQEVGESATPQNVLNVVGQPSWRGRSQQIISLQQKIADLQIRLSGSHSDINFDQRDRPNANGEGDSAMSDKSRLNSTCKSGMITASVSSIAPAHRQGLAQQDMKKQELISKLTSQMDELTFELKCRQQELKASKARAQTLELQMRSSKHHIDLLEAKIHEKESEGKAQWNDMNLLKQELISVKDREKRSRDKSNLELQEVTRALTRERAIVKQLQGVINDKQEAIQRADEDIIQLRNKLELCCSNNNVAGGINAIERIHHLEAQLQNYAKQLTSTESDCKRLTEMVDKAVLETETERQKAVKSQREAARIFLVLEQANQCIDECLDAAQVTNTSVLEEVENMRTLIRELKTGELYSLDPTSSKGPVSVKKMKSKIDLLGKEMKILQTSLGELSEKRKQDMNSYARVCTKFKESGVKASDYTVRS